jgi:hypothetical protein
MTEDTYRELLIGCGRSRDKRIAVPGSAGPAKWRALTTLDLNPNVGADLQCDLNGSVPWHAWSGGPSTIEQPALSPVNKADYRWNSRNIAYQLLPDYWDEIHAYEVLEHLGQQGDAYSLLMQFSELWRLLKPNGYLCATVPSRFSPWLWGDPSHRRVMVPETLTFLDQNQYRIQCDGVNPTPMSDFRDTCGYRADFRLIDQHDNRTTFTFILQAVKPSRWMP